MRSALALLLFAATALAAPPSTIVTAASTGSAVRFTAPGPICQIRVEVDASDGTPLFDSSWRDGNVVDWQTGGLAGGVFRCVVEIRDLDGRVTRRVGTIDARSGQVVVGTDDAPDAIAVVGGTDGSAPKVTLLAHDGTTGEVVSTGGDLSFRFGDFLAGKDAERMRLTSAGRLGIGTADPQATLDVNGSMRVGDGILFSDGSKLTTQSGQLVLQPAATPQTANHAVVVPPRTVIPLAKPSTPKSSGLTPRFVVGDTGVGIWNASPANTLDVGGVVNTTASYNINSVRFVAGNVSNTFLGSITGPSNTGTENTFVGADAGHQNTTGNNNTFVGTVAGDANTTGSTNVFVGIGAGTQSNANLNTFVGGNAGSGNTSGTENAFFGAWAGGATTTGSDNLAIGAYAITGSTGSVSYATAIGPHAYCPQGNTVVIGSISGQNNATATQNVGITLQNPNQALGVSGGITVDADQLNNGTDSINTVVAFGVGQNNGMSGEAIGSQRTSTGNLYGLDFYTQYVKRLSITNNGQVGIGTSSPTANLEVAAGLSTLADAWTTRSSARFKKNIEPIAGALEKTEALQGVAFDYKDSGGHSVGFIAEDVEKILPEAVQRDADGQVVGLDYNRITPLLVEAVKTQEKTIRDLEERLAKLEQELAARK